MHGGSVEAHSAGVGQGSTFAVRLPVLPAPAKTEALPDLGGALQGRNDFRRVGYGGPCPPPGPPHHYFFKLYALDAPLRLKAGVQKHDVEAAMRGHTLGTTQLVGMYARQKK